MTHGCHPELVIPYDKSERVLYRAGNPRCLYHDAYPRALWHGIYRHGRFPEVVVRAAFIQLRHRVLMSDPDMPNQGGYILTHYAGKREQDHEAFKRMTESFAPGRIRELNQQCDRLKLRLWGNRGGGDPDLFVVSPEGERFFVEVKDKDHVSAKQMAIFRKIEDVLDCEVRVARVRAMPGARPADVLREQLAG